YGNAALTKMLLQIRDTRFGVVKDRRGQRRIGVAAGEDVDEMIERAGAARGDHRNVHRVRHRGRHVAVEAGFGAVAVHRREADLALAALPLRRRDRRAGGAMSCGCRRAAVLRLTLSAPASITASASASERIPPP